jgi:hypothetical protein
MPAEFVLLICGQRLQHVITLKMDIFDRVCVKRSQLCACFAANNPAVPVVQKYLFMKCLRCFSVRNVLQIMAKRKATSDAVGSGSF